MEKEAERVDVRDWESYPAQESMIPNNAKREKPTTDQRKIRRKMRRARDTQNKTQKNSHVVEDTRGHMNKREEQETVLRRWASKERVDMLFRTAERPSLFAIRAQQVLDYLEDKSE